MTNKHSTKKALIASALSLVICFTMLLGTTFAWFTDTVTSTGNIIKSGKLDVAMEWKDATATGAQQTYKDASEGAIFNYDLWEPGYVEAKNVKIANVGTLALKYQLAIVATGAVSKLADVIDVYYAEGEYTLADRSMTELDYLGTLTEVLAGVDTSANGDLKATESDIVTIAFKMQEDAGNEYQNLSIGTDFAVKCLATQLTFEEDSFDDQYDADAPKTEVATAAELQKVLNEGGYAVLTADIAAEGNKRFDVPAKTYAVIDLNGYTLTSKDGGGSNTMAIYVDKGAVLTLNDSVGTGKIVSSCYGVYVKQNAKFIMNGGTLDVSGNGVYDMAVTLWNSDFVMNGGTINSKFGVWASNYYRDNGEANLPNCYVKIADGCTLNSTGYADVEVRDALDSVVDVPADVAVYPARVSDATELKNALANGEDVVLTADVVLTDTATIPAGAEVNIDLNGYTVTAPDGAICAIKNEGTLVISGDGVVEGSYSALYSNGNLTVNGGTFTASEGFGLLVDNIYGTETSVAVINDGIFTGVGIYNPTDVTINGGTFNAGRDPDGASDLISDEMTLFISPTFVGAPNTANVTLNGGTFNGDIYVYDDGITETVFVNNGATINGDVLDNS